MIPDQHANDIRMDQCHSYDSNTGLVCHRRRAHPHGHYHVMDKTKVSVWWYTDGALWAP